MTNHINHTKKKEKRSIVTLSTEELEKIVFEGVPSNIDLTLEGLEERQDFQKLFSKRIDVKKICEILWKERVKMEDRKGRGFSEVVHKYEPVLSEDFRREKLQYQREALALKKDKLKNQTDMFTLLYKKLQEIEKRLESIEGLILNSREEIKKESV